MLWGEVGDILCFTAETCSRKAAGVFGYEKGGALLRNHHVLDARKDGNEAALIRQPKGQAFTHRALANHPVGEQMAVLCGGDLYGQQRIVDQIVSLTMQCVRNQPVMFRKQEYREEKDGLHFRSSLLWVAGTSHQHLGCRKMVVGEP